MFYTRYFSPLFYFSFLLFICSTGGMQDYNYIVHKTFELTIEMSCCKFPNSSLLPSFWKQHKNSLINFLKRSHMGNINYLNNSFFLFIYII